LLALVSERQGSPTGIIHLLPLSPGSETAPTDLKEWRARLAVEVKGLFYLAQAAADHFAQVGSEDKAWIVCATRMGGTFASTLSATTPFSPTQGAVAGLLKTLALEWPAVTCKVVDFDINTPHQQLVACLLSEMAAADGIVEVGYRENCRFVLQPEPASLNVDDNPILAIDANSVILVTGGARGITAEVAHHLAEKYRPVLLLVGRSALPDDEPPDTIALTGAQEIKTALIARLRATDEELMPARVEAAYTRLLQDREIRRNLRAMEAAGATVHYYQADMRVETDMASLLHQIYATHGRLDGVIHGAGIIEDKLLKDKSVASFDRVFDTKTDSAFLLSRLLQPESLKFLVFFSSVAGRFGNRGQSDYTAANEVLNKLAIMLDRHWPGRVVSINWGPWLETGMAADRLKERFEQQGVQLVSSAMGRQKLDEELHFGRKGQVEVILGRGPWSVEEVRSPGSERQPVAIKLPFLDGRSLKRTTDGALAVTLAPDPNRDAYLNDHRLDGKPVLPAAVAAEMMAEVAQHGWPGLQILSIHSLRVLRGLVFENGSLPLHILARPRTALADEEGHLMVDVSLTIAEQPPCYRATLHLGPQLPASPHFDPTILGELHPLPLSTAEAYQRWLFHGDAFRVIEAVDGLNERGITGVLKPSGQGSPVGPWLIDPMLLDGSFQLAILWERAHFNMTPLPTGFEVYHRFSPAPVAPVRCYLQIQTEQDGHTLLADIFFLDAAGRMIGKLDKMAFSCTVALNRLARSKL
jgi:NAD(P)-dependent dehydrogenase (short-subunit alcohol dehydrogenase family)